MSESDRSAPRLVLGDDRSSGSDLAWLWVNSQRWPGWELVVLTADPPPYGKPVPPEQAEPHPIEGPPPRTAFAEAGFGTVRFLTARADPRTALATCPDVTALVVGAAGEGLGPWHLGSTTEWLLHGPPAPMVVARTGRPVRSALVCADGSSHATAAIEAFASMPWSSDAAVTIVAVEDGRTIVDEAVLAAEQALKATGTRPDVVRERGTAHRRILSYATSNDIDLIVLGTRGHAGLSRMVLGSTASAVNRHAGASVLSARAV